MRFGITDPQLDFVHAYTQVLNTCIHRLSSGRAPTEWLTISGQAALNGQPKGSNSRPNPVPDSQGHAGLGLRAAVNLNGSLIATSRSERWTNRRNGCCRAQRSHHRSDKGEAERSGITTTEKPPDVEPSKPDADGKLNGNGSRNVILEVQPRVELPRGVPPRDGRTRHPLGLVIIGVIAVIAILAIVPNWIQKWLWMRQVGYSRVFWTLFSVRWELFGVAFVVALLYLWINLRFAAKNGSTFRVSSLTGESALATKLGIQLSPTVLNLAVGAGASLRG